MTSSRTHLGDSHNFGRRVSMRADRVAQPRTLLRECLVLAAESRLQPFLDEAAERDGLGRDAFGFLPSLKFFPSKTRAGGEVERVALEPLPAPDTGGKRALAAVVGRSIGLWSWLDVADLHWENLVLGINHRGRVLLAPLDIVRALGWWMVRRFLARDFSYRGP
jgi:hypothetical protein